MPRPKKFPVALADDQRDLLRRLIASGTAPARKLAHARILLKVDGSPARDAEVASMLEVSAATVLRVRRRFAEEGFASALEHRHARRFKPPKLDGRAEARLIALACADPPEGRARWTLRLLADALVELDVVEGISHETVRRTLGKNELKPHLKRSWCIPPKQDAAFVCAMEDVLDVYERPYDPKRPVVCFDEKPVQLVDDVREGEPTAPGRAERVDYEYRRNGSANVFGYLEPLRGWRAMEVTERRTKEDFARCMRRLTDEFYPEAEVVIVVLDNLSSHSKAALYATFEPEEARRVARRLEFHFTPRHGSWLNAVEIEFSALGRQCLDRRVASIEVLRSEVGAWETARNERAVRVDWQFRTADARVKLRRLYPTFADPSGR